MKNKLFGVICVLVFVLAACAGNKQIATVPVQGQNEVTVVPTDTRTFTPAPSNTPLPKPTLTATASITPTATMTPENFVLAEGGFDIASVRVSNLSGGAATIDFKYRIDASQKDPTEKIIVKILIPAACSGVQGNDFETTIAMGGGYLVYKLASQGRCELPYFDMVILFKKQYDAYNETYREVYRERINQPFTVAKNSLTINSKTLTVKNFSFQATGPWSGQFTFDYAFSTELSDLMGKYHFSLAGTSDFLYCGFNQSNPVITDLDGTYTVNVYLKAGQQNENGVLCFNNLDQYDSIAFKDITIFLGDNPYVFQQTTDFAITFKKAP